MREIRPYGSEGGEPGICRAFLPPIVHSIDAPRNDVLRRSYAMSNRVRMFPSQHRTLAQASSELSNNPA
jgi:hypothetical protein